MPWARLDDNFHDHPKVDGLSLAAVGLYTLCLTWAHRHRRTAVVPGHITEARVRKVARGSAQKLATELTDSGLWENAESAVGGYLIHDFSEYLPKERDPTERAQAGRKGAAKRWQADSKPPGNLPSADDGKPDSNLPSTPMANPMANDGSRVSARAVPTRTRPSEDHYVPSPEPETTTTADLDHQRFVTREPPTVDDPWAPAATARKRR